MTSGRQVGGTLLNAGHWYLFHQEPAARQVRKLLTKVGGSNGALKVVRWQAASNGPKHAPGRMARGGSPAMLCL